MDVAGLLLGISSLFPICVKGYKLIATAKSFPEDSSILFWKLKTQELRFIIWGQTYGFDVRDLDNITEPLPRTPNNAEHSKAILDLTHGVLSSIKDIVCSVDALTTRYGLEEIRSNVQISVLSYIEANKCRHPHLLLRKR